MNWKKLLCAFLCAIVALSCFAFAEEEDKDARIAELEAALNIPLVLHGGSGIENDYILRGIQAGIAKINVGTELRQPYERAMREKNDVEYARECVYTRCRELIRDFLRTAGDAEVLAK